MTAMHHETARGMVYIHSAPKALCPHIEWAIGRALGDAAPLRWDDQPVLPGARRTEHAWFGEPGSGAALASALRGWPDVRFEVTEHASAEVDAGRWMHTPSLGIAYTPTDQVGNALVTEDRLRYAMEISGRDVEALHRELRQAMCEDWDAELEAFRHASDAASIIWLHKAG